MDCLPFQRCLVGKTEVRGGFSFSLQDGSAEELIVPVVRNTKQLLAGSVAWGGATWSPTGREVAYYASPIEAPEYESNRRFTGPIGRLSDDIINGLSTGAPG
jgi:hypothetical protein